MHAIKYCIRLTAAAASAITLAACVAIEPGSETLEFNDQTAADTSDHDYEYFLGSTGPLFDEEVARQTPLEDGEFWACPFGEWAFDDDWLDDDWLEDNCAIALITGEYIGAYSFEIRSMPNEDEIEFSYDSPIIRFRGLSGGGWLAQITGNWTVRSEDDETDVISDMLQLPAGSNTAYGLIETIADGFALSPLSCGALPDQKLVDLIRSGQLTQGRCVARTRRGVIEIAKSSRAATGLRKFLLLLPK